MKKPVYTVMLALLMGSALAVAATEKQTQSQQPMMGPGMMGSGMMGQDAQTRWGQMQKNMEQMQKTKDPKQREKLMQQNIDHMQGMMKMMQGMGMGPGMGMMGGYGYPGMANSMANMTNWMQSIENRMWVMQQMLNQMQPKGKK